MTLEFVKRTLSQFTKTKSFQPATLLRIPLDLWCNNGSFNRSTHEEPKKKKKNHIYFQTNTSKKVRNIIFPDDFNMSIKVRRVVLLSDILSPPLHSCACACEHAPYQNDSFNHVSSQYYFTNTSVHDSSYLCSLFQFRD